MQYNFLYYRGMLYKTDQQLVRGVRLHTHIKLYSFDWLLLIHYASSMSSILRIKAELYRMLRKKSLKNLELNCVWVLEA